MLLFQELQSEVANAHESLHEVQKENSNLREESTKLQVDILLKL